MQSFLLRNLRFTIQTALAFAAIGYIVSIPMSFYLDGYAARWQFSLRNHPGLRIETERLNSLRKFQIMVALGSTALGVVVAQTTFAVHTLAEKDNHESEG